MISSTGFCTGRTMARGALAFPPTFGRVEPGLDAYLYPMQIRELAATEGRYWSFKDRPTTVALPGNRYAKSLASFHEHQFNEPAFRELLREFNDHGVDRPGGYADAFHDKYFKSPRIPWSVNAPFQDCLAGGWQACLKPGVLRGTFRKYDMRSAYLWAASLGMPDTKTYTRSLKPWRKKKFQEGLFRVQLIEPTLTAPSPFSHCTECIATSQEIEMYNLRISSVVDGVVWTGTIDGAPIIDAIKKVSFWKLAARAYWGRWGQVAKIQCVSPKRKW